MRAGPESVVHLARNTFKAGGAIGTGDVINAFNTLKRNPGLANTDKIWPEATKLIGALYGIKSLIIYIYQDDDGNTCAGIKVSEEGTRMGCTLAQKIYNMSSAPGYSTLDIEFPEIILRAMTDDLISFIPDQGSREAWIKLYDRKAQFLERWDQLFNPLGLFRHKDKGVLLLPPNAPDVPENHRLHTLTKITREGLKIGGGVVGTDAAVSNHALAKVESLKPRADAIKKLATVNSQAAMMLTATALNSAMDYQARITPPEKMGLGIRAFDDVVDDTSNRCLSREGLELPDPLPSRAMRASAIRQLPCELGGCDQIPLSRKAPCAYLSASLAVIDAEPLHRENRKAVAQACEFSYELVRQLTGITDLSTNRDIAKVLPPTANDLANPPDHLRNRPLTKYSAMRKVQRVLVRASSRWARKQLIETYSSHSRVGEGQTMSDIAHTTLSLSRSQASRVFRGSLWFACNRVPTVDFVASCRYILNLPQLQRPGFQKGVDVGVEGEAASFCVCSKHAPATMDPTGGHTAACTTAFKARYDLHTSVNRVVGRFAKEAGGVLAYEPQTSKLLLDSLTAAQCRTLFPRYTSRAAVERAKTLSEMWQRWAQMPPGVQQDTLASEAATYAASTPAKWKGLRIDLQVLFPDGEVWVDVGTVHSTRNSSIGQVFNWTKRLTAAENDAVGARAMSAMAREASPVVAEACKAKVDRYDRMRQIAVSQHAAGKRPFKPSFYAAIMSHAGEFSPDLILLVELFTKKFDNLCKSDPRHDGISRARRTGDYRCRFKDALIATGLTGFGRMLNATGEQPNLPMDADAIEVFRGHFFDSSQAL